jgi:hypothetical protein
MKNHKIFKNFRLNVGIISINCLTRVFVIDKTLSKIVVAVAEPAFC